MKVPQSFQPFLDRNQLRLEPYTPELFEPYRQLVLSEYGEKNDISSPEYIRWQYQDNPAGPAYLLMLLTKEGQAAGAYCVIPIRVKIKDTVQTAALSLNTITHKDYRGRGFFTALLAMACENGWSERSLSFIYGFPNPNSYPGFVRKAQFTDVGKVPLLLKPFSVSKALAAKKINLPAGLVDGLGRWVFRPVKPRPAGLRVFRMDKADPRLDDLWEKNKQDAPISLVKDRQYLQWRYFDNPVRRYAIFGAEDSQRRLRGYMAVRETAIQGVACGLIGDALVDGNDGKVFRDLLTAAESMCMRNHVALGGTLLAPHDPLCRLFRKAGYWRCPRFLEPQPFRLVARPLNPVANAVAEYSSWRICMGDYDIF